MEIKIDTKEKFHVITPLGAAFTATMAEEIQHSCTKFLLTDAKNVVLNLAPISTLLPADWDGIVQLQLIHNQEKASFVACALQPHLAAALQQNKNLAETLNYTPTESEAADIVQMEEIERELMDETD